MIKENEIKAMLVGICLDNSNRESDLKSLDELEKLAGTAGISTVGKHLQNRKQIDKTYYLGRGFIAKTVEEMKKMDAELLLFDNELSPSHARNIRKEFDIEVADRTEIILTIFHDHAMSREARLQVELAEMKYQLPRLKKLWSHLDRERGSSRASGGTTSRGMGEKQIEVDKRQVRAHMLIVQRNLKKIMMRKKTQRKQREQTRKICLVGYTNAGKSLLFNRLTHAGVLVEDKLFATLDSTARRLQLAKGQEIVISDTVGFIADLPHHLVASFHATLLDVKNADLLLHVIDIADPNFPKYMVEVEKVLREIGCDQIPQIKVLNKMDKKIDSRAYDLEQNRADTIMISAKTGQNVDELLFRIDDFLHRSRELNLIIPHTDQKIINLLHRLGMVIHSEYLIEGVRIKAVVNMENLGEFGKYIESDSVRSGIDNFR